MSDGASERLPEGKPFVESAKDDRETPLAYGPGRLPWWVGAVWIAFLIGFVAYLSTYFFPDVSRWGNP